MTQLHSPDVNRSTVSSLTQSQTRSAKDAHVPRHAILCRSVTISCITVFMRSEPHLQDLRCEVSISTIFSSV